MKCLELAIPPLPSLVTVGHAMWLPGNCHFERSFDVYDVIFVKSGAMYMREDREEYVIRGGQLLVLEPGKTHAGSAPCTEETEVYWVHFKHAAALRRLDAKDIPWSAVLPQGRDSDTKPSDQTMYLPKHGDVPFAKLLLSLKPHGQAECAAVRGGGAAAADVVRRAAGHAANGSESEARPAFVRAGEGSGPVFAKPLERAVPFQKHGGRAPFSIRLYYALHEKIYGHDAASIRAPSSDFPCGHDAGADQLVRAGNRRKGRHPERQLFRQAVPRAYGNHARAIPSSTAAPIIRQEEGV